MEKHSDADGRDGPESSSSKDETSSSHDVKVKPRLSLSSIPSIDRSDDEMNPEPNLAHTPPESPAPVPNLAHTPPPPAPRPPSPHPQMGYYEHTSPLIHDRRLRSSIDKGSPSDGRRSVDHIEGYRQQRSPSAMSGLYGAIGNLYTGIYSSGSIASAGAANYEGIQHGQNCEGLPPTVDYEAASNTYEGVPPVPPPLDPRNMVELHQRDGSSLRDFNKSSLNQFISTSPKLSNRDMEINRMSVIYSNYYGRPARAGEEIFEDPVEEEGGERVVWEYHNVQLTRLPNYGFGIAVSGGRDNPHFRNGDPSIAISDVLKNGPAEGKLEVNDRLISANGVSLENVDYARAVQVLRDSGQMVQLVVKRRIVLPSTPEPQTVKVSLQRSRKKDDYGIILGCRIYIKEIVEGSIADKEGSLREGDVLLKVNSQSTDNMTLKEAKKLIDGSKDRLQLMVKKELCGYSPELYSKDCRSDFVDSRPNYATQNLYVQPPTRLDHQPFHDINAKSNLRRFPPTAASGGFAFGDASPTDETYPPPRPPLPRPEDYFTRRGDPSSPSKPKGPPPSEPRFVSFKKEGSVGIRLTGGNDVGIFVTAVQPKSQAQLQGLMPGDKILKVNDMDMAGVTREEAVLYLMSLQDQIDLIVQTRLNDYHDILNTQKGDLFYIRTHFHYEPNGKSELSFRSGDIFRVVDTLHNGVVGAWLVYRIGRNNQDTQKGVIPNKARAEEIATAQFNAAKKEQTQSESRSGFFRRRRNSRRSKSLGKDHWEDVVFADSVSKFPAYERVTLRHPGFVRPVVLFGPMADIARDKLLQENPEKFASPQLDSSGEKPSGIIRLSAIREILERGKHAILDITPNAVDRLNYAQFYPVVLFLRAESKQTVKELRTGFPKGRMSSKKLFDQSVKLEKLWSHVFTSTINVSQPDTWYKKMKDAVDKQQSAPIWVSEAKPSEALTDDFLFPMTSRLSYASSPESDMETAPESRTSSKSPARTPARSPVDRRMVKSSSDPSIAAQEDQPAQPGPPPYSATPSRMSPYETGLPLGPNAHDDLKSRMHPTDYRYSRSASQPFYSSEDPYSRTDMKPLPPPKGTSYKPVPPPKPKGYNYKYDRYSGSNGGVSDDYSGLDSGQGSSLDRKYDTFGRSQQHKQQSSGRTGYYLNVPPPRDLPPRDLPPREMSHGRDLPNHDHRGSAFELYKKPSDPRNPLLLPQYVGQANMMGQPHYLDQGAR